MPGNGELVFCTKQRPADPVETLRRALPLFEAKEVLWAHRSVGPDREMKAAQETAELYEELRLLGQPLTMTGEQVHEMNPYDKLGEHLAFDVAARFYREGTCLRLTLGYSALLERMWNTLKQTVSPDIRGEFTLSGVTLCMGEHDILQESEDEPNTMLVRRRFFSVRFDGCNVPNDWAETRRLIFQLPVVQKAKRDFEAIVGPLEQCMIWDI